MFCTSKNFNVSQFPVLSQCFFLYIFKGYKILLWDTKSFWPSLKAIIPNMNKLSKAVNNCNNEEDMWTYLKNSNATSVSGEILQFFFIRKNLTCKKLLISRFFLNVFFRCLSIRRFIFKYPIHRYNVGDLITVSKKESRTFAFENICVFSGVCWQKYESRSSQLIFLYYYFFIFSSFLITFWTF